MDTSACIFFFFTYFLANNSKILFFIVSHRFFFLVYPERVSGAKVPGLERSRRSWRDWAIPGRANDRKLEQRRGASFPVASRFPIISRVSFSRACIDSGSSTRLSRRPIVDIRKGSESEIGEGESQRWNRDLFVAPPPFSPLLVQPCTLRSFHPPRAPLAARARACSPRTSCIYLETSFREATKISEGVTYSGVKKFGNGDRTDLSDRLVVRNRFDFSFIIFLNISLRNMLL